MDFIQTVLFGYYPYVAIMVCVLGCIYRLNYAQYGWKSGSSQLLSTRYMHVASNSFHIGIILLLMGHFVGLLTPASVYTYVISVHHKQLLAMTAGGIFGSICFVGLTMLVCRRLFNPRVRATSSVMDIVILLLLYLQLILGLSTIPVSYAHSSGTMMEALANWAQYIVILHGETAAQFIFNVPLIYKLHILTGLTIILLFPFTRLVHILSAPIWYFFRRGYQLVRRREAK